jgi:RNA polymerase sigma-70 factor (ECF subfamily)
VAWEEFTEIYSPVVFRLALRHGLQLADADDLAQEVSISVARFIGKWLEREDRKSFRAWLFTITRNCVIDFMRKRTRRRLVDDGSENSLDGFVNDDEISSEFGIEYRREVFRWASERVRQSVSESSWQAFWQTSVEDRPIKDVAEEIGQSVGSVYIARSRVMKRLKELVKQYEELTND